MNLIGILNNVIYTIHAPVLLSHITAGFVALMAALTTGVAACLIGPQYLKQHHVGKFHLRCWQVQTFATLWVSVSALFLALVRTPISYFLFIIGLFTLYMSLSGYLSLIKRNRGALSRLLNIFIIVVGAGMLIFGIANLQQGDFVEATPILFGVIAVLYGLGDSISGWINKNKSENRGQDNKRFLARSLGAVIATITAFLVVNIDWENFQWIVWIGPTIAITPLITYLRLVYRKLLNQRGPRGRMAPHMQHLFEVVERE